LTCSQICGWFANVVTSHNWKTEENPKKKLKNPSLHYAKEIQEKHLEEQIRFSIMCMYHNPNCIFDSFLFPPQKDKGREF
jgi:hypothetical protein